MRVFQQLKLNDMVIHVKTGTFVGEHNYIELRHFDNLVVGVYTPFCGHKALALDVRDYHGAWSLNHSGHKIDVVVDTDVNFGEKTYQNLIDIVAP
jgi:hypothetical protein